LGTPLATLALPAWVGIVIGWLVSGAALWKGGWSERAVAAGFIWTWIGTALTRDRTWANLQVGPLFMDVSLLVVVIVVAMRSSRYWPLFAAGFQLLAVITHAAHLLDPNVGAWAYVTAGVIWTYLLLLALAFGTWSRWREPQPAASAPTPGPATRR
jgi:hypothetical protein